MSYLNRIKNALHFRMNHYLENVKYRSLLSANGLNGQENLTLPSDVIITMETILNYLQSANILIDVGAHKGLFSSTANKLYNFDISICFEPNSEFNTSINSHNKHVNHLVENMALSNEEGEMNFYIHGDSSMSSLVEADNDILNSEFPWDNPNELRKVKVPVKTLDGYLDKADLPIEKVFFIKIDTQGNELSVLKGAIETLENTEVVTIEFMFFSPYKMNYSFADLVSFMTVNNFICKGALTINKRPSKKISAVDFLFVKE